MASPAWFFSTLAQATAAIIGLTIAFTVSTHLSRRERRQNRTDEAREEWTELSQRYQPVLDSISQVVREETDFESRGGRYNLTDVPTAVEWAESQNDAVGAKVWALSSGISNILSNLTILETEITREQISTLQEAVQELEYGTLYRNGGPDRELYTDITGLDPDEADGHYYFDDIIDSHGRIGAWLDRNRTAREENIAGATPDDLTGSNLFSIVTISEMMDIDLDEVAILSVETDVTADFLSVNFARNMIIESMKLAFWGVFLPTLLLVSEPDLEILQPLYSQLPNWVGNYAWVGNLSSLAVQVVILLIATFFTLRLFAVMLIDIGTTVPTMRDLLTEPENRQSEGDSDEEGRSNPTDQTRRQRLFGWLIRFVIPDDI